MRLRRQALEDEQMRSQTKDAVRSSLETQTLQLKMAIRQMEEREKAISKENERLQEIVSEKLGNLEKSIVSNLERDTVAYKSMVVAPGTGEETNWVQASEDYRKRFNHERQMHEVEVRHLRDINEELKKENARIGSLFDSKIEEILFLRESMNALDARYRLMVETKNTAEGTDGLWQSRFEVAKAQMASMYHFLLIRLPNIRGFI
jgi:hypothetical protein